MGEIKGNGQRHASSDTAIGFPPIAGEAPRVLILGSLPSRKSLEKHEYYGHPQNAFWKIMATLAAAHGSYEQRAAAVAASGIAVWDVLASSVRPGSMDADIDLATAVANPIDDWVAERPSLHCIGFNGRAAEQFFRRLVPQTEALKILTYVSLPSTSPAYARLSVAEKTAVWREALRGALPLIGDRAGDNV